MITSLHFSSETRSGELTTAHLTAWRSRIPSEQFHWWGESLKGTSLCKTGEVKVEAETGFAPKALPHGRACPQLGKLSGKVPMEVPGLCTLALLPLVPYCSCHTTHMHVDTPGSSPKTRPPILLSCLLTIPQALGPHTLVVSRGPSREEAHRSRIKAFGAGNFGVLSTPSMGGG